MSLQDFRRGRGVWKRQVETKATTLSWEEWHREYRMDFPDCIDEERRRRLQTLAKNAALKRRAELIAPGIGDLEGEELGQALSKYASTYETNVLVRLVGKPDRPPSAANTSKRPRKVNPRRVMKKKGKKKRKGNIKRKRELNKRKGKSRQRRSVITSREVRAPAYQAKVKLTGRAK